MMRFDGIPPITPIAERIISEDAYDTALEAFFDNNDDNTCLFCGLPGNEHSIVYRSEFEFDNPEAKN